MRRYILTAQDCDEIEALSAMTTDRLKALWDQYDGIEDPEGYNVIWIQHVMNNRGYGSYVAI